MVRYPATKHAVVGLTEGAAVEWADHGIRMNAVAPGLISTPFISKVTAEIEAAVIRGIPQKRIRRAEEVGSVVLWLLSEECSYVTGRNRGHRPRPVRALVGLAASRPPLAALRTRWSMSSRASLGRDRCACREPPWAMAARRLCLKSTYMDASWGLWPARGAQVTNGCPMDAGPPRNMKPLERVADTGWCPAVAGGVPVRVKVVVARFMRRTESYEGSRSPP